MPRFSVVVPTRDRPDLLDFCLQALAAQTLADVEVVVSDNPEHAPARAVFDRWERPGWRYVRPERPLAMHDNFELGCDAATGEHVAVVIDKTVLHPSALEVADRALRAQPADIVTWHNEGYDPVDEAADPLPGRFRAAWPVSRPALYDARAELARRFANAERRGADRVHYGRGKIVFGAFSRALLQRIRDHAGRVFHPLAPDYTSMVPACLLAEGALDVGRPLLVSYSSTRSNGYRQSVDPAHARAFIERADPAIVQALPIPGLYTSMHNVVAYDLASSAARCPALAPPQLDLANLVRRAREDLRGVRWTDAAERDAQHALLAAAERQHGVEPAPPVRRRPPVRRAAAAVVLRVPPLARLAERLGPLPPTFASPFDAASAADRHYAGLGAS
jgi:hypothetical protein